MVGRRLGLRSGKGGGLRGFLRVVVMVVTGARAVARGKLSEADRDALLGHVTFAVGLSGLGGVDLVIVAVPEHLDLKQQIFAELDKICKPEAILATNSAPLVSVPVLSNAN